jgi:hypothetical protein
MLVEYEVQTNERCPSGARIKIIRRSENHALSDHPADISVRTVCFNACAQAETV